MYPNPLLIIQAMYSTLKGLYATELRGGGGISEYNFFVTYVQLVFYL